MKTVIEMAREAGFHVGDQFVAGASEAELERFASLVRADERNSWPAEMEAMERQVNILTDALAQEREACANVCENIDDYDENIDTYYSDIYAAAIRARSNQ